MFSKKGYFLSLGGGENQLPLIKAALDRGWKVITVDRSATATGFTNSHIKIIESTSEYRKIYNFLLKTLLDAPVIGVGCRSFGKATVSAAYLSEKLGVPGNPREVVRRFQNKATLKKFLGENGIPIPRQFLWNNSKQKNLLLNEIIYPCIEKPIDGEGKKGIHLYFSKEEFLDSAKKTGKNIFLEEFISGQEFTVLGFVENGRFHLVSLSDKVTTSYPPFLELAHILPTTHPEYAGEIRFLCQRIAQITGLVTGPFVAEFKADGRGNLYLMEAMPEIGGEFLADKLLIEHSGYDYFQDYLRLMTGEPLHLYKKNWRPKQETQIRFLAPPEGKNRFKGFRVNTNPYEGNILFDKTYYEIGQEVDTTEGNKSRVRVFGSHRRAGFWENIMPGKALRWEAEFEHIENS